MEGTARIWFTPQQRAELWERWQHGQCVGNGQRLASDGAPLGKKRLSGNWRITDYRVLPERRAQSFEQVFRFDKEANPSL